MYLDGPLHNHLLLYLSSDGIRRKSVGFILWVIEKIINILFICILINNHEYDLTILKVKISSGKNVN